MRLDKFYMFNENKFNFIEKSKVIHSNFYSYDKVIYHNARTNVRITCPTHGDFDQLPYNHLSGKGCPICGINRLKEKFSKSREKFIEESRQKHGDKYDYSVVDYKNDSTKVEILCPEHGSFYQRPNKHLRGSGCPSCRTKNSANTFRKKYSEFFPERSNKIHNNKYDYSQVDYKNNIENVKIVCPTHGVFSQRPSNHLLGKGCLKCAQSHGERKIETYLINHDINFETQKKFDDCINKIKLSFDFWLIDHNILIEFDGEQHYKPVGYRGGVEKLEYTIKCDNIKNDYCLKKGIKLIRISYKDISDIDHILDKIIKL